MSRAPGALLDRDLLKVVVADDSELALDIVRDMFEAVGAEVHTVAPTSRASAAAGAIGLSGLLRRVQPDVVVLDLNMPAIRGDEAAVTVRRICPHAIVVIYSDDERGAECARANGVTWVSKAAPEMLVREAFRQAARCRL